MSTTKKLIDNNKVYVCQQLLAKCRIQDSSYVPPFPPPVTHTNSAKFHSRACLSRHEDALCLPCLFSLPNFDSKKTILNFIQQVVF